MNLSAKNCPKIKAENHLLQKDCNLGKLLVNYPAMIIKDEALRDPLEPFRLKPLAEEPAPTGLSSGELFKKESLPFLAHGRSDRIGVFLILRA